MVDTPLFFFLHSAPAAERTGILRLLRGPDVEAEASFTTAIAHPSQASAPSHYHHSDSSGDCAYSCTLKGHGGSTFDDYGSGDCGECSCWG